MMRTKNISRVRECIFEPVTQSENNCVSACIAMLTGLSIDYITEQFHDRYYVYRNTTISEYLTELGLPHRECFTCEWDLKTDHIYLLCTPSVNIRGSLHEVITQVTQDGMWYFCDPNEGRDGRITYSPDKVKSEHEFLLTSWVPDIEVNIEELLDWRHSEVTSWRSNT